MNNNKNKKANHQMCWYKYVFLHSLTVIVADFCDSVGCFFFSVLSSDDFFVSLFFFRFVFVLFYIVVDIDGAFVVGGVGIFSGCCKCNLNYMHIAHKQKYHQGYGDWIAIFLKIRVIGLF